MGPQAALCKGPYSYGHLHELLPEEGTVPKLASSPSSEMREVALRQGREAVGGTVDTAALSHGSSYGRELRAKFAASQGQADK